MRGRLFALGVVLAALLGPGTSLAAIPAAGTVGPASTTLTYKGSPATASNPGGTILGLCAELDPACDSYKITVVPAPSGSTSLNVTITMPAGEDYDAFLFGPDGSMVDSSGNAAGEAENLSVDNPEAGVYRVGTIAYTVTPLTQYNATVTCKGG